MFDLVPYVVKFTLDVFVFLALLGNFVLFFSKVYFEVICSTCIWFCFCAFLYKHGCEL